MKKIILLIALVAFSMTSQAQVTFSPGMRAGVNISNISNIESPSKTGFYIAAIGSLKLAKFYTLQPEIGYSNQGAKDVSIHYYGDFENGLGKIVDINLDYISITVMNKFSFEQMFLQVGPSIDLLVSSSEYVENDIDISTNIGLGIDLTKYITLEARFKMGLMDVINEYDPNYPVYKSNRGRTFQIGGVFRF